MHDYHNKILKIKEKTVAILVFSQLLFLLKQPSEPAEYINEFIYYLKTEEYIFQPADPDKPGKYVNKFTFCRESTEYNF